MALNDLNTFGDLAREINNVSAKTVCRWWKRLAPQYKLKVKKMSERTIFITKGEAERFLKLCDHVWDDGSLIRRERRPKKPHRQKRR